MNGITFGDKHSYTDLGLILSSKEIGTSEIKTSIIDIPGRSGSLDMTEALGGVKYEDRDLRFTFTMLNALRDWAGRLSALSAVCDGRLQQVILDDDPDYYYYGRPYVTGIESEGNVKYVTVSMRAEPYKLKVAETTYTLTAPGTVELTNDQMEVVPTVTATEAVNITCGTSTVAIGAGTFEIPGLALEAGTTTWEITGSGDVTISYQEGKL